MHVHHSSCPTRHSAVAPSGKRKLNWVVGQGWIGFGVRVRAGVWVRAMALTSWAVAHLDDVVVVGRRKDSVGSGRVLQVFVVEQDLVPAVAAGVTSRVPPLFRLMWHGLLRLAPGRAAELSPSQWSVVCTACGLRLACG